MSRGDHSNKTRDVAARLAREGWIVAHLLFEHDLFRKPVLTFRDHALRAQAITFNIGIRPSRDA
jgi:hypothetical protein